MNAQKVVKFNLIMSCVLLSVFILMFIGATIAYFFDSKQATTTFTSGKVEIMLSESPVTRDASGNLVKDTKQPRRFGAVKEDLAEPDYIVYPGTTIYKDPTITNTGDAPEWIAAKVILTDGAGDLHKVVGYSNYDEIDIEQLIGGGLLDEQVDVEEWNGIEDVCVNDRYAMIQLADRAEGRYEFFFLMLQPVGVGESVILFDEVMFDPSWNNVHMQELRELKIHVEAYGVQTQHLADCLQAMTAAFPEKFPFNTDIK